MSVHVLGASYIIKYILIKTLMLRTYPAHLLVFTASQVR